MPWAKVDKIRLVCPTCNKIFEKYPSYVKANKLRDSLIYCSRLCSDKNRKNVWKIFGKDTVNFKDGRTTYRSYALKSKGYVCEICGYDGKEFPSLIWVHHKDFDKRNKNRDNSLNNLEVLCIRCHMEKHLSNGEVYKGGFHAIQIRKAEKIPLEV